MPTGPRYSADEARPNCAATLDTHCAKTRRVVRAEQECQFCHGLFTPKRRSQRYCSRRCGHQELRGQHQARARKVDRPPYPQLLREVHAIGFSATGRRYGVSDNAVRKWLRAYERDHEKGDAVA